MSSTMNPLYIARYLYLHCFQNGGTTSSQSRIPEVGITSMYPVTPILQPLANMNTLDFSGFMLFFLRVVAQRCA